MNWVRTRAKRLSLLALFALAVQFGLSFGHVHATAFGPISAKTVFTSPSAPDSNTDHDTGNDVCAICATIAMANTLVDATPPVLPLPAQTHTVRADVTAVFAVAQPQHFSFQSRAPPRS
ncbi:MAG: DUF2946 domain-containing protein [Bradyrhizobiaceae bacterium]|nr:MAG: DUF2946 domain-containing protein [Bradyrhizobiaceae bacterium]